MPLITSQIPEQWDDLEALVAAILNEAGLQAQRDVSLPLPRGSVKIDVLADETQDGIVQRILCECKNWNTNVPKGIVHAFRTVVQEAGANRGYIISKIGFQAGAIEAAQSTNIELTTFADFQSLYFSKWYNKQLWDTENELGAFNTYYEPFGKPGYSRLEADAERAAYDRVWNKYLFAGMMLELYSPYNRLVKSINSDPVGYPSLPLDVSRLEEHGIETPADIGTAVAYREFFTILTRIYANWVTRTASGQPDH
ncbi:MAG TPA: restriction endonuclease [Candidatus Binataceae bacterium]|nr:restriction endonuclease [Candidatus Binataceae bacterium]